jgi:hypothetical protein
MMLKDMSWNLPDKAHVILADGDTYHAPRAERIKAAGDSHVWDGPTVVIGWVDVPTCSVCGIDASNYGVWCKESDLKK